MSNALQRESAASFGTLPLPRFNPFMRSPEAKETRQ